MGIPPAASLVIPTLDRPQELDACLRSLHAQTCQDYQLILLKERGSLATLRNEGLRQARAPVVCYLDDDTICSPTWLSNLLRVFRESPQIVGVSGPAIIPQAYRYHRDLFRYVAITQCYEFLFIFPETRPGYLTPAGTFVPTPDYAYEGFVQFLEACNMAFRTEAIRSVGGFDEIYQGIGDWSEPDVCFRLLQRFGDHSLFFSPSVWLEHRPSQTGAYWLRRQDARQRLANYRLFANRWVTPSWRHWWYRRFLECYYLLWPPLHALCDLSR